MSTLEVNKIIPQGSGTALQIAESGDTVTLPSGSTLDASAATVQLPAGVGGISWESKTANFNAVDLPIFFAPPVITTTLFLVNFLFNWFRF